MVMMVIMMVMVVRLMGWIWRWWCNNGDAAKDDFVEDANVMLKIMLIETLNPGPGHGRWHAHAAERAESALEQTRAGRRSRETTEDLVAAVQAEVLPVHDDLRAPGAATTHASSHSVSCLEHPTAIARAFNRHQKIARGLHIGKTKSHCATGPRAGARNDAVESERALAGHAWLYW
eukprot:580540-Rhodomonas_salina.1